MGDTLSVRNDTKRDFSASLHGRDGKAVGFTINSLAPKKKIQKKNCRLPYVEKYTLKIKMGGAVPKRVQHTFFGFRKNGDVQLNASELIEGKYLYVLELQGLVTQILPGLRIEDRESYGEIYEECFIANELVSYMIIHKVAKTIQDAEEMCQKLLEYDVLERVVQETEFKNKYLFFRLNTSNKAVMTKGQLVEFENNLGVPMARFHSYAGNFAGFKTPRVADTRSLEGWLEKKNRLGVWQMRFFRIIPDDNNYDMLAYFDDSVNTIPKEVIEIIFTEDGKNKKGKTFYIRAPRSNVANRWLTTLQQFSNNMSPIDVVNQSALVLVFSRETVRKFTRRLKEVKVRKGDWICKSGEKSEMFYLLREGKIACYVTNGEGKEENLLCYQKPVSSFGEEVMFTDPKNPPVWNASRKAAADCTLLYLSPKERDGFLKSEVRANSSRGNRATANQVMRKALRQILVDEVEEILSGVPFFQDLTKEQRHKLRLGLQFKSLQAGQVLFYEGDAAAKAYIVFDGKLDEIQYSHSAGSEVIVKTLEPGIMFGEVALMLKGIPQTTSVRAVEDSLLLALEEHTFRAFLEITKLNMGIIARAKLVAMFQDAEIPFFENIPRKTFIDLARVCTLTRYEPGEVIFREGDKGDRFYMVSYGEVEVSVGGKAVAYIMQGGYFGEIGVVVEAPRTATCTASSRSIILSVDKEGFQKFFAGRPAQLAEVELKIAGHRAHMRSVLYHERGVELFREFLESQYAEEHVDFWLQARSFRKRALNCTDEKALFNMAKPIWDEFIKPGGDRQVNISAEQVEAIEEKMKERSIFPNLFFEAEEEVVGLLYRDKMRHFVSTQYFEQLMESIGGCYNVSEQMKTAGVRKRAGSMDARSKGFVSKSPQGSHPVNSNNASGGGEMKIPGLVSNANIGYKDSEKSFPRINSDGKETEATSGNDVPSKRDRESEMWERADNAARTPVNRGSRAKSASRTSFMSQTKRFEEKASHGKISTQENIPRGLIVKMPANESMSNMVDHNLVSPVLLRSSPGSPVHSEKKGKTSSIV
ncbi:hypothetical protein AAMO2058_000252800 [Amorphochlora amoebiformis]